MSENVVAFPAKGRASAASGTALSSASRIEPASGLDQRLQSHDAAERESRILSAIFGEVK